jgi:hypothetical protein
VAAAAAPVASGSGMPGVAVKTEAKGGTTNERVLAFIMVSFRAVVNFILGNLLSFVHRNNQVAMYDYVTL